jgi:cell division septation protein DedD
MEEQTSWRGHSFTLLVFTGIVILSSIFFILGMLVGRAQGQKLAGSASNGTALSADAKAAAAKEDSPSFTFYDSVKKDQPAALQPAPKIVSEPIPADPAPKARPAADPPISGATSGAVVNYQIGALRKGPDAEKLLNELKRKGFRAFILAPAPGEANPLYRVQVGPFPDSTQAQEVKKRLEAAGYQPILKK